MKVMIRITRAFLKSNSLLGPLFSCALPPRPPPPPPRPLPPRPLPHCRFLPVPPRPGPGPVLVLLPVPFLVPPSQCPVPHCRSSGLRLELILS